MLISSSTMPLRAVAASVENRRCEIDYLRGHALRGLGRSIGAAASLVRLVTINEALRMMATRTRVDCRSSQRECRENRRRHIGGFFSPCCSVEVPAALASERSVVFRGISLVRHVLECCA
jgi:hypothetical protein